MKSLVRTIWILDLTVLMTCAAPLSHGTIEDGYDPAKAQNHACIAPSDPDKNFCENLVLSIDPLLWEDRRPKKMIWDW